jgi:hypothetical protein
MTPANFQQLAHFVWSVADLLRGPYRPPRRLHEVDEELKQWRNKLLRD